jgi:hypothetical protein
MGGHRPDTNVLWVEIDCNGESTTAHSAGIFDGTGAFAVGAYPAFGQHFDGVIDEASVWRADKSGDCETLRDGGDGLQYPWDGGGGGGGTARRLLLLGVGK